jgi:hypothetical protein
VALVVFLASTSIASAGCDFFCAQRWTPNEHCTEIIAGDGDMASCRDNSVCSLCPDGNGGWELCCIPRCDGQRCLLT